MEEITITVTFSHYQARAFAQFVKRAGYHEYKFCAVNDEEAFDMQDACEKLRKALAKAGYAPR